MPSSSAPKSRSRVRVVQIGCGAWGRNILRELSAHPDVHVAAVVDPIDSARDAARRLAPKALVCSTFDAVCESAIDAAVIASPGPLHAAHALEAVARGWHLFVEKPLATSSADAALLAGRARERGAVGMVGHLMHFHPAAKALIDVVRTRRLGRPICVRAERRALAGSRDPDGSVLWSLAPHDVSLLLAVDDSPACVVRAEVLRNLRDGVPVEAAMQAETRDGVYARIVVSRTRAAKYRNFEVTCESGTVTFEETALGPKLYVTTDPATGARLEPLAYEATRTPLAAELDAFIRAILHGDGVVADFEQGLRVVRLIEDAERLAATTL